MYLVRLFDPPFWLGVLKSYIAKRSMDSAAVLAYTSLVALVPALALALSVLSVSDLFAPVRQELMTVLVHHLMPSSKPVIEQYFVQFSQQASHLKGLGSVSLLMLTLVLLWTVDERIHLIWGGKRRRKGWRSLSHYLGIAILGPLLLGMSLVVSSYLNILPWLQIWLPEGMASEVTTQFSLHLLPILFSGLGFFFLYRFVPMHPVSWQAATTGAALVTMEIEGLKYGFHLYLQWFPTYDLIYGAFAAIPVFLLWLYLLWSLVLFNAHVVYCLMQGQRA